MTADKHQRHELVAQLPDAELAATQRCLQFLLAQDDEAPVEPEMLARIDAARANPAQPIPHEEVLREFGL